MSNNILLCYYTPGGTSYYQDFAEEFIKNGNNVLHWNFYLSPFDSKNKEQIIKQIQDFNPNLVFSYNNICPEQIIKIIKSKICILDADNPEFFHNKEVINKYDFLYLGYQSISQDLYKRILGVNISDKNYLPFFTATNFQKDSAQSQNINISFIGSNFYRNFLEHRSLCPTEMDLMLNLSKKIRENYYFQDESVGTEILNFTKWYMAGQQRLKYLSVLSDLGLKIYSNSNWKEMMLQDFELANCYNEKVIITKKDNQDLYNSSKVSINLSHPQATNSFSWRVPDIMASNACLVMEDKVDWHNLFGNFISQEVKDKIIYKDQYDMRQKCIDLLNNEALRLRCVKECQDAIEQNGRWGHRIESLQNKLNMHLIDLNNKFPGVIKNIDTNASNVPIELRANKKVPKSNLYFMFKFFIMMVYFLPIIGSKIIKKKTVRKILGRIFDKLGTFD